MITAGEECGCQGARKLAATEGALGQAGAVVIAEPTGNRPMVGHKGVLWAEVEATGVTAHASMPHKGDNAVYKVARAITRLERFSFAAEPHPVLGPLTLNVGWVHGGVNINSVPDRASFGLDMRLIPGVDREALKAALKQCLGGDVTLKVIDEGDAVWSDPADPWVAETCELAARIAGREVRIEAAPYFTDACALQPAYGGAPTLILGPGEAGAGASDRRVLPDGAHRRGGGDLHRDRPALVRNLIDRIQATPRWWKCRKPSSCSSSLAHAISTMRSKRFWRMT